MPSTAPPATRPPTPQQNRERKARLIARAAWRRGLTAEHLRVMPYSGEDRSLTRFARAAYRESEAADHDLNPPSSPQSRTWRLVAEYLAAMTARADAGLPCPGRDLLAERQAWLPDDADPAEEAAPDSAKPRSAVDGQPAGLASEGPRPPAPLTVDAEPASVNPRGWDELAALPPLDHDWCIHHPDRRPVVITPDGPRCGDCPPRRGEIPVRWDPNPDQLAALFGKKGADGIVVPFESVRDGWGIVLDWAPKHCNGPVVRCYCGRCPKVASPD